ncbi:MAG: magnesium chelatase domain-containing protein, partial [Candidatus Delongbacteria bacterium]
NEIGMFEMGSKGLIEVKNASQYFLNEEDGRNPGTSVTASLEGTRPLLLEIQALVTESRYGTPQRNCVGFDIRRLSKIVAVLDKILGFNISNSDIFLNVTGGVKLSDPGADMSVAASLVSSFTNVALPVKSVFCGEIGLGGEIRAVSGVETRINECLKLGFEQIYLPKFNLVSSRKYPEQIIFVSNLSDIISMIV